MIHSALRMLAGTVAMLGLTIGSATAATATVTGLVEEDGTTNAGTIGEFNAFAESDPNGLGYLSSGSYVYFEADNGTAVADSLIMFDRTGVDAARFSVLASTASLAAVNPGLATPESLGCEDIAVDPDTDDIYAIIQNFTATPDQNFVVRIPSLGLGTDTFGPIELAASSAVIGDRNGAGALVVNTLPDPNELLILHDNQGAAGLDETDNVLYRRPVDANPASPSTVVATFSEIAAGCTPAWVTGDTVGFGDLAVLPDGDYVIHNAFGDTSPGGGAGSTDGDIVRWDVGTDTPSIWVEGDSGAIQATSRAPLETMDNGHVAIWRIDNGGDILRLDDTGAVVHTVVTSAEITAGVSTNPAGLSQIANSIASDGNMTFGVFHNADPETLIEIVDTAVPVELSVFTTD